MVWSCLVSILPGMAQTEKLTDYVNPFVGTDGYGNVYPGAQIPIVRVTHMIRSGRPPIIMLWNWQTMESKPK